MADYTLANLGKMKVTELRKECEKLGLDFTGLKATLVSRIREFHNNKGVDGFDQSLANVTNEESVLTEPEISLVVEKKQDISQEVEEPVVQVKEEEPVVQDVEELVVQDVEELKENMTDRELVINEDEYEELDYFEEPENAENFEERSCDRVQKETADQNLAADRFETSDKRDDTTAQHSGGEESDDQNDVIKEIAREEFEELNLKFNSNVIQLDPYNSDLHFLISKEDCLSGCNMVVNELSHFWCSAKASYGVGPGKKVYYDCKFVRSMDIKLPEIEAPDNALRVGFSTCGVNHLGDHLSSVGIENSGRVLSDSIIVGSSPRFTVGDSILVCVDTTAIPFSVSFFVNGIKVDVERHLSIEENANMVIVPHVYFKNVEFTLDFTTEHSYEGLSGYIPMGSVGREFLFPNYKAKPDLNTCILYMVCGPIACGKTYWSSNFRSNESDSVTVLGRSYFYERWRVLGQRKKIRLSERVVKKALEKVLSIASHSYRTFILDQTNCYLATRKKRLEHFTNFPRKVAVVILPSVSEYDKRIKKVRSEEFDPSNDQRKINDDDIMELKKKFEIPNLAEGFDEIIYVDTSKEFAQNTLEDYKYDNRLQESFKKQQRRISSLVSEIKAVQKRLRLVNEENIRRKRRRSNSFERFRQYPPPKSRPIFRDELQRRPLSPRRSRPIKLSSQPPLMSNQPDYGYRTGHTNSGFTMKPGYPESNRVRITHPTGPSVSYGDMKSRDGSRSRGGPNSRNERMLPDYNKLSSRPKWVGNNISNQRDLPRRDNSRGSARTEGSGAHTVSGRTRGSYGGYTERQPHNPYGRY